MGVPSAKRAAQRALVLSAVTVRAYLENEGAADTTAYHARMLAWIREQAIGSEFEAGERSFVSAPIGKLGKKRVTAGLWRSEGLVVLAWALGYAKLPAHNEEADQQRTAKQLGFMHDPVVLKQPKLKDLAARRRFALVARAIHWRVREATLRRQKVDLESVAKGLPFVAALLEEKVPLVGGDLRLGRLAVQRAPASELQHALSIAAERHIAANWLIGTAPLYSAVDTAT